MFNFTHKKKKMMFDTTVDFLVILPQSLLFLFLEHQKDVKYCE
jgi:hypothetical protein